MKKSIILASSSPRRFELLKQLKLDFEVIPSNFLEKTDRDLTPAQLAVEFASLKSLEVANRLSHEKNTDSCIVIGADTLVVFGEKILEKPENEKEARQMLSLLSGNKHKVITGVCLVNTSDKKIQTDWKETDVWFKKLEKEEIERYITKGEWKDKAGAYGIQGFGALFVERIDGCYYNVVGLPLVTLNKMLGVFGIKI